MTRQVLVKVPAPLTRPSRITPFAPAKSIKGKFEILPVMDKLGALGMMLMEE